MKTFGSFHPLSIFIYFVVVIVVSFSTMNPVLLASSLLGAMLFLASLIKKREMISNMVFYFFMFILLATTNPLFNHNGRTPLFFMNGNAVTLEAVVYGAAMAVMLIGVIFWSKCYSLIITSDKFIYLFGVIIPRLSLILSMALKFIPVFKAQLKDIRAAQKTLGLYSSESFVDRLLGEFRVFSALVSWSLENSMETSTSMKARGYGLKGRSSFNLFTFRFRDVFLLANSLIILAIVFVGIHLGIIDFYYYPAIRQIPKGLLAMIIYGLGLYFMLLPFCIETGENLHWKYLKSKI